MIPDRLQTENLSLRPFVLSDAPAVYDYWKSDPGWERFNASVPAGFTHDDAVDFVVEMTGRERLRRPNWALEVDGGVVGVVSLNFEEDFRVATVGYGIHAGLRGRGLCQEAVEKVLDDAFSAYPELERIAALTDRENRASIRVLHKIGFSEEPGVESDGLSFSLARPVWEARQSAPDRSQVRTS